MQPRRDDDEEASTPRMDEASPLQGAPPRGTKRHYYHEVHCTTFCYRHPRAPPRFPTLPTVLMGPGDTSAAIAGTTGADTGSPHVTQHTNSRLHSECAYYNVVQSARAPPAAPPAPRRLATAAAAAAGVAERLGEP